jgi:hypothetical protein
MIIALLLATAQAQIDEMPVLTGLCLDANWDEVRRHGRVAWPAAAPDGGSGRLA